jgi:hypothetical protein
MLPEGRKHIKDVPREPYIEESIRLWVANLDSEMNLKVLKQRRPFYHPQTVAELKRRGIVIDKYRQK